MFQKIIIVHGGELAKDVAEQMIAKAASDAVTCQCASERPKKLVEHPEDTLICFIMQTIENASATEEVRETQTHYRKSLTSLCKQGGTTLRFFQRKTHPSALVKFSFAVLGLGDSNLLLDRQTTSAKDCNQVAQQLDARLEALGGKRFLDLGMADERTGLSEVEPWIEGFWARVQESAS